MSAPPHTPGFLWKYNVRPSRVRFGACSFPSVLIRSPRFTGVSQGLSTLARCETQRSKPPFAPARSDRCELIYSVSPSLEIAGCESESAEFTTRPMLMGADQGDQCDVWCTSLGSKRSSGAVGLERGAPGVARVLVGGSVPGGSPGGLRRVAFGWSSLHGLYDSSSRYDS